MDLYINRNSVRIIAIFYSFFFFILELLEYFEKIKNNILGFEFVNNTDLVTWGGSAADNYRKLTAAYDWCIAWAKRHST